MNIVLARIGMAAVLVLVGMVAGAVVQEWRFNSGEKARLEKVIKAERAEVTRLSEIAFDVGQALGAETNARLDAADQHRGELDKWKRKGVVHVQCPNTPKPVAVPESAVSFDADYVRLWNGGLCLAVAGGERAACAASGVDDAGEEAEAPVTPGRLLGNVGENAVRWGECLDRLAGWQAWARKVGLTGGPSE